MAGPRIAVVGGGAAGFFAAIACAREHAGTDLRILERGPEFLSKVRISGGGRCNVTNACFDPRELAAHYPRGERELLGPFHRFQPSDTIQWFEDRGVELKTEPDGRVFPVTDSSATIIDCLVREAVDAGVSLRARLGVDAAVPLADGGFRLTLSDRSTLDCDRLLIATGGCRTRGGAHLVELLGHTIAPPVPSLFTFHVATKWLRELPGLTMAAVDLSVPDARLRERGSLLITHEGVSGPAVLRLSAWGARSLHALDYRFALHVNWLPSAGRDAVTDDLVARRDSMPKRLVVNVPTHPIPARLWRALVLAAGIDPELSWNELSRAAARVLASQIADTVLPVSGKSLNKDEFVTCGGVRLREVDFRMMESRVRPGLHFAGEVLDIDGVTGGFNFQAAWTTGWIAGHSMGGSPAVGPSSDLGTDPRKLSGK